MKHDFARNHMRQHLPGAGKSETLAFRVDLDHHLIDANYWFLFPNTLIGQGPGAETLAVSRVMPLAPEQCLRDTQSFVSPDADPAHLAERDKFYTEKVGAENRALVESVQKGMRQRAFHQGLYIIDPDEENFTEEGVRFFHRRYAAEMGPSLAELTS